MNLRKKIAENRKKRQIPSRVSKIADSTTTSNFPNVVQLIQNSYAVSNGKTPSTDCHNSQYDYKMDSRLDRMSEKRGDFVDLSQSQSSPASNTSAIREHISDEYRPNCDSLATNSSNNCFDDHCFDPKDHYLVIDSLNSSEMQFSNKCTVITDGSIESIKNNCIESFGCFNENSDNSESKRSVIQYNKRNEIPNKVYQKAIELEFAAIPIKDMLNNLSNEEFNKYESQRISELAEAVEDFNQRMICDLDTKITSEIKHLLDATKIMALKCDEAIRRLVIMSKKITAFRNLCQHDHEGLVFRNLDYALSYEL